MATDKNALLWAIRGIEDTDTLKVACEELERVLWDLSTTGEFKISGSLEIAISNTSGGLYAVMKALPERNTSLDNGVFID